MAENVLTMVTGHSNTQAFTHDACGLQVELQLYGADMVQAMAWNPFWQVYTDPTKGSLFSPADTDHANMAVVAIFCGGQPPSFSKFADDINCLDFLVACTTPGMQHHYEGPRFNEVLRLPFHMPLEDRCVVLGVVEALVSGTFDIKKVCCLRKLVQDIDVESPFVW